jgi:hypothetical protein
MIIMQFLYKEIKGNIMECVTAINYNRSGAVLTDNYMHHFAMARNQLNICANISSPNGHTGTEHLPCAEKGRQE